MTDSSRPLAAALATELLIELHAAAEMHLLDCWSDRLRNAVRACSAIVSELQAGRVVMVVADGPGASSRSPVSGRIGAEATSGALTEAEQVGKERVCESLVRWARIAVAEDSGFEPHWQQVYRSITKSCLLDRMVNLGLAPSETPCPVHEGRWSGIQWGHPGDVAIDKTGARVPIPVEPRLQAEYDAGCRCFQHGCGCTTGWQPSESVVAPRTPPEAA